MGVERGMTFESLILEYELHIKKQNQQFSADFKRDI